MDNAGKKAAFCTLGCKLNFSETSSIASSMEEIGFTRVEFDEVADVYVINTCSVTGAGEKSSRNMIRRALRKNPEAVIVVTGCYAQLKPEEISRIGGVDLVLGTTEKYRIPELVGKLSGKSGPAILTTRLPEIKDFRSSFSPGDRTRNFLKIQDGCDYFCSFCVVPFARGRSRNASIAETVASAGKVVESGFSEIVLTGVNIGDFGKSTGESFAGLLKELEKVEGLKRLRIGSVEPNLLTDEIIDLAAASRVIMPHFHLPLQSGSDEILALMKRRYNTDLFASRVLSIRERIPLAFIGVDVIAGTNGESENHFRESYNFINSLPVSQLHAFPYSERPGTQALKIPMKVPVEERKLRTQKYVNLSVRKLRAFYRMNIGTTGSVLFEEQVTGNRMAGFTANYIRTECDYQPEYISRIADVKLLSVLPGGNMMGRLEE